MSKIMTLQEVQEKYAEAYELSEVVQGKGEDWVFLAGNTNSPYVVQHHSNGFHTSGCHDSGFDDLVCAVRLTAYTHSGTGRESERNNT